MQILKFKKTDPKAIIPRRQTEGAAGFDLHALEAEYLHKTTTPLMVRTGISVEIPPGHVGLIRDRSGLAAKHGVFVLGGVIDSDYTGEVKVLLAKAGEGALNIQPGDHVGNPNIKMPGIRAIVEWSKTGRGGRQYDWMRTEDDGLLCSSLYGLCE